MYFNDLTTRLYKDTHTYARAFRPNRGMVASSLSEVDLPRLHSTESLMKAHHLKAGTLSLLFLCFALFTTGCHDSILSSNEEAVFDSTNNDTTIPGDDDGTPDQGSGDNGDDSNTPGDDDGTPDQGSGDNGEDDSDSGSDDDRDDDDRMEVRLSAETVDARASGKAKYEVDGSRKKFSTEVEDVSVDGDGEVIVYRGAAVIFQGAIRIQDGVGDLNRDTEDGHTVPSMREDDRVEVYNANGALILTGKF